MNFLDRPLAIVDVETSGDDELKHEILGMSLLIVNQRTFEIINKGNWLIRPNRIEDAIPAALDRTGYNNKDWKNAEELKDVMLKFSELSKDCIYVAYNVSFDWPFIKNAFRITGVPNLMDYHHLDVMSLAWSMGCATISPFTLNTISQYFGVPPEPRPNRAINGASNTFEILKKIKENLKK